MARLNVVRDHCRGASEYPALPRTNEENRLLGQASDASTTFIAGDRTRPVRRHRACESGLIVHTAFYADKVRDFGEINKDESVKLGRARGRTWRRADRSFADEFRPDEFKDEYCLRPLSTLEKNAKRQEEITQAPHRAREPGRVIDVMGALKKRLQKTLADGRPAVTARRTDAMGVLITINGKGRQPSPALVPFIHTSIFHAPYSR